MHCGGGFINFDSATFSKVSAEAFKTPLFHVETMVDFSLSSEAQNIIATFLQKNVVLNETSKQYSDGRAAGIAFVNQGGDFLAGRGMGELEKITGEGIVPFGAVSFGENKYKKIGSYTNINGYGVLAGIGKKFEYGEDKVIGGVLIEHGSGDYKSYNNFFVVENKEAKGSSSYTGVGVLGKIELGRDRKIAGLYVEGAVRVGNEKVDYKTSSQGIGLDVNDQEIKYDYNALYYGFHIGAGYSYKINNKLGLEGHGRYTFMRQEGKDVKLIDDNARFNEVMSHRIRVGIKGKYEAKANIELYIGMAGEQELDGEIKANALYNKEYPIESIKLGGVTGIGELGLKYSIGNRWKIDISGEGFVGNREGLLGSCRLSYFI
ncbi:MAG: autotransporter outer membrane beta-barrel domain-containing protein [Endomicrobium sp.]|jgi:hypothetical protein|nr:autotransporter outer membrane beta-barrel domain-containing protein [Endomicrobium sp.]